MLAVKVPGLMGLLLEMFQQGGNGIVLTHLEWN
jgi:hypothetical protein